MRKNGKSQEAETVDAIRARITSSVDQFLMDLSTKYSSMEKRGRRYLWRSLGEAAVFVMMAEKRPSLVDKLSLDDKYHSGTSLKDDDTAKKVIYHMMKPEGKIQITMASKYVTTVRYLISEGVEGDEFVDALKEIGGIEAACKRFRAIRKDHKKDKDKSIHKNDGSTDDPLKGWPKIDQDWLKKHSHIDMGHDTMRLFQSRTVLIKVKIENTSTNFKKMSGEIVSIEE